MPRLADARVVFALAAWLAASTGCTPAPDPSKVVQVGRYRVRLVPLHGWEHLDHGRQQLFRNGDAELLLVDYGVATRAGLAHAIGEAETLWLVGRKWDAFARMRELHGPPIRLLPSQARADFWKPWTDVTYVPEAADSAQIGPAFRALIRQAGALPDIEVGQLMSYVLATFGEDSRREIAERETRRIHDAPWVAIETWDRTSHLYRRRLAYLERDGTLLVLWTQRGLFEQTGSAFDSLLATIDVLPSR